MSEGKGASLARANELLLAGARSEAGDMFARLLAAHPDDGEVLHGLGVLAWQGGDLQSARDYLRQAAVRASNPAAALSLLGDVERQRGDLAAALQCLESALKSDPRSASAHCNLGMLRLAQEQYLQAASAFLGAIGIQPEKALFHYNLGIALKELNRLAEAIECYRTAIALQPDFVEAHVNLALALLLDGQLEAGFAEYEWRRRPPFMPLPLHDQPQWTGTTEAGGSLLLRAEQGLGDAIQMVRYVPQIAAGGMKVIVECRPELEALFQTVAGVSATCRPGEPAPAHSAELSLASLPSVMGTRLGDIPAATPYLHAQADQVATWRQRLLGEGETIKVGLRWAGNPNNSEDRRRSCPLALFSGLAGIEALTLIGLNNEPMADSDQALARGLGLVDYSTHLTSFAATAALLVNLDLVIAVDTAVLHLAGALGVPSWALLRFSPHWPWLLQRSDSPWYPGMRLFRQPRPGDWQSVATEVVTLLSGAIASARSGDAP